MAEKATPKDKQWLDAATPGDTIPDGFQFVLIKLMRDYEARIKDLESRIAVLEGK